MTVSLRWSGLLAAAFLAVEEAAPIGLAELEVARFRAAGRALPAAGSTAGEDSDWAAPCWLSTAEPALS